MDLGHNVFFALLFVGVGYVSLLPCVFQKGLLKLILGEFFIQQKGCDTLAGTRENAKALLDLAEKGDTDAKQVIADSLRNRASPFYGVFRVSRTMKKTVLTAEPSRPVVLIETRDQQGDTIWKPSTPAPLNEK